MEEVREMAFYKLYLLYIVLWKMYVTVNEWKFHFVNFQIFGNNQRKEVCKEKKIHDSEYKNTYEGELNTERV